MAFLGPIGTPELIIIMIVLLLLFGAKRLPEMGKSLGRGMREFKDSVTGVEESMSTTPPPPAALPSTPSEPAPPHGEAEAADEAEREAVR